MGNLQQETLPNSPAAVSRYLSAINGRKGEEFDEEVDDVEEFLRICPSFQGRNAAKFSGKLVPEFARRKMADFGSENISSYLAVNSRASFQRQMRPFSRWIIRHFFAWLCMSACLAYDTPPSIGRQF